MTTEKNNKLASAAFGGLLAVAASMVIHDAFIKRDIHQLRLEVDALKIQLSEQKVSNP